MKNRIIIIIVLLLASVAILATPAPRGRNVNIKLAYVDDESQKSIRDSALARYPNLDIATMYLLRDAIDEFWNQYVEANLYDRTDVELKAALDSILLLRAQIVAKEDEKTQKESYAAYLANKINDLNNRIDYWKDRMKEADGWESERDGLLAEKQKLEDSITGLNVEKSEVERARNEANDELAALKAWEASFDEAVGKEVAKISSIIENGRRLSLESFNPSSVKEAREALDAFDNILKQADAKSRKDLNDGIEYLELMGQCQEKINEAKVFLAGKYNDKTRKDLQKKMEKLNISKLGDSHQNEFRCWLDAVGTSGEQVSEYKVLMTSLLDKKCIQFEKDFNESSEMIDGFKSSVSTYYTALKESYNELRKLFTMKNKILPDDLIFPAEYKERLSSIWSIVSDEPLTTAQQ